MLNIRLYLISWLPFRAPFLYYTKTFHDTPIIVSLKKLFSKWVPRLLTVAQKQQRIDDSKSYFVETFGDGK